ncbi:S-adenosyl-L-methionine-dependent methyltransferase, putative [Plasmodium gallinaceum]|uniref:S-adenosyl-L-methionine-dependent methyltransferase, putative n=1 Tax=Plasmodium gallinaceum TaxID=5849 RepID=A0A1J1GXC7_PLAGA|nr:S-adenosyl-L-methionine-dependent methyltransferase, putative [Plasmodium gallinaceum]CRG97217.1 S-adenosyl-L-methionine-dependent methyltransferase, putative [Plasmodium gallinaceum]
MSFLYRKAAQMLLKCSKGEGIKEVLLEKEDKSVKKLYSILYNALEDLNILDKIYNIYLSKICKNKFLGIILLSVLVHRHKIDGGGKLKREIQKKEKEILNFYKKIQGESYNNNILQTKIIWKYFLIYGNDISIKEELTKSLQIVQDEDIKNLYKINNDKVKMLIDSSFYRENKIRIIDKTSCLVVKAGHIKKGMVIVDICSSPGSKAIFSLISLKKKGYLICVEKNKKRCFTLLNEILKIGEYDGLYLNERFNESEKIALNKHNFLNNKKHNIYYIKHKHNELTIKIYNCDFLNLSSEDFPDNIDVVFIDPSCSSSGMPDFVYKRNIENIFSDKNEKHDRSIMIKTNKTKNEKNTENINKFSNISKMKNINELYNRKEESKNCISETMSKSMIPKVPSIFQDKVKKLSDFQKQILTHALVKLKGSNTFIYSTCSLFEEENEQVIHEVLQKNSDFYLKKAGKDKFLYNNYKYDFSKKCVRTFPEKDLCRGIFISKICRKKI